MLRLVVVDAPRTRRACEIYYRAFSVLCVDVCGTCRRRRCRRRRALGRRRLQLGEGRLPVAPVSYTHLTLPTTPYV